MRRRTKVLRPQSAVNDAAVGTGLLTKFDLIRQEAVGVRLGDAQLGIVLHLIEARDAREGDADAEGTQERVGVDRGLGKKLEQTIERHDGTE